MLVDDIKTIDDVLIAINYDINVPDCEVDDIVDFNTFSEVYDDIIDTLNKGPVIVRTDIQASLGKHDWCKYVYENEKVKAVYYLDPIANLEYLKEVLEGCDSIADNIHIVLRHKKEVISKEQGLEIPYDQLDVWKE